MLFVFKHRSFITKLHFEILLKDIFCFKVSYTKNLMWIKTFLDKDLAHTFPLAMCQISICKSSISNSKLRLSYIPPLLFFYCFGFFFQFQITFEFVLTLNTNILIDFVNVHVQSLFEVQINTISNSFRLAVRIVKIRNIVCSWTVNSKYLHMSVKAFSLHT